jgi:hypothetical protein
VRFWTTDYLHFTSPHMGSQIRNLTSQSRDNPRFLTVPRSVPWLDTKWVICVHLSLIDNYNSYGETAEEVRVCEGILRVDGVSFASGKAARLVTWCSVKLVY